MDIVWSDTEMLLGSLGKITTSWVGNTEFYSQVLTGYTSRDLSFLVGPAGGEPPRGVEMVFPSQKSVFFTFCTLSPRSIIRANEPGADCISYMYSMSDVNTLGSRRS